MMFRSIAVAASLLFVLLATAGATLAQSSATLREPAPAQGPRTTGITEFPLPTANAVPLAITTGPDGNLWFTESNHVGRVTPAGVIAEFSTAPITGTPDKIVSGPGNSLWFSTPGVSIL